MTNEYGQQPYPGQQPGYGQQQQPQQGYGYPPQTPPGGQPVYAGQPYPQQGQMPGYGAMSVEKPGTITGAAVLAFIQAGITLITTIILIMGLVNASSVTDTGLGEPWAVAIAQFLGVILLIVGSVQLLNGSSRGLFLAATGLEVVLAIYWAVRFGVIDTGGIEAFSNFRNSLIVIAVGFAVMPVIALILGAGSGVGRYVQAKQGR